MAYAAITKPELNFNTKLYTGNGTDNHGITGVGFQPDFTWIKPRNEARGHAIFDAVRGATKMLISNESSAEGTYATTLKSFDSDGFNLGTSNDVNKSSNTHVAWNWKANGAGSSNSDGSTASTVSANTAAGFSMFKFTGTNGNTTVGHGLGGVPEMFIIKNTAQAGHWMVYHKDLQSPAGKQMYLNLTNAQASDTGWLQNTAPSSSVITLGANADSNGSGNIMIGYAFRSIKGYSKVGSYSGNGSATNGSFVYCGFKPAFVFLKVGYAGSGSDFTGSWNIFDNRRPGYNLTAQRLVPNLNNAEADTSTQAMDLLSNGFKLYSNNSDQNSSSGVYMYYAIAENPLVANVGQSIPATAR